MQRKSTKDRLEFVSEEVTLIDSNRKLLRLRVPHFRFSTSGFPTMGLSSAGLMFVITGGIALVACVLAGIYVYLYLTQMKPREDVMRKHARPKASVSKLVSRRCVLNRDPMAPTPQVSDNSAMLSRVSFTEGKR